MRYAALLFIASFLGCAADAQEHRPGPVSAGPSEGVDIPPGASVALTLEDTTDPLAVDQTVGLVVAHGQPVVISGRVATMQGAVTAAVQLGPRDGPWRTVAVAADPPVWGGIITYPQAGEYLRVLVTSALGARVAGGDPRQTWVTAFPIDIPIE